MMILYNSQGEPFTGSLILQARRRLSAPSYLMSDYDDLDFSQEDYAAMDAFETRLRSPSEPALSPALSLQQQHQQQPHASTSSLSRTQSGDVSLFLPNHDAASLEFDLNGVDWNADPESSASTSGGPDADEASASDSDHQPQKSLFRRFRKRLRVILA